MITLIVSLVGIYIAFNLVAILLAPITAVISLFIKAKGE